MIQNILLISLLSIAMGLVGCSKKKDKSGEGTVQAQKGPKGEPGQDCKATEVTEGIKIICGDKEYLLPKGKDGKDGVPGKAGKNGANGKNGADGKNGVDGKDGADGKDGKNGVDGKDGADGKNGNDGKNGSDGKDGEPGKDGKNGADGKDGAPGKDGQGCTAVSYEGGVQIECGGKPVTVSSCTIKELDNTVELTCGKTTVVLPKKNDIGAADNPLLNPSPLEYGAYQWDKIKPEHIIPAIKISMEAAKKEFLALANSEEEPTFENTIAGSSPESDRLGRVLSAFYGVKDLLHEDYRPLEREVTQMVNEYTAFLRNKKYYVRVKKLYERLLEGYDLPWNETQKYMILTTFQDLERQGLGKSEEVLKQVAEIERKIGDLNAQFDVNVSESKKSKARNVSEEKLVGLPAHIVEAAKKAAEKIPAQGFVLELIRGVWMAVQEYSEDPELRKALMTDWQTVAYKGKHDNSQIILDIAKLRRERAELLGYKSNAEIKLQNKMAKTPETVIAFKDKLAGPIKKQGEKELKLLQDYAKSKGADGKINYSDVYYWKKKYSTEKLGVDSSKIREYLTYESVLENGVLWMGEQFWGLEFKERKDLPVYHEDVRVFEVAEKGKTRALLYVDPYARPGKGGVSSAWVAPLRHRSAEQDVAILHMVTMYTKGVDGKPNLISLQQARTLFHEMGHAYHVILSDVPYASIAGTNVEGDFVEAPSQVLENFMMQPEFLQNFAKHWETGEVLPETLIKQVRNANGFMNGHFELRQMELGYTDLKWNMTEPLPSLDGIEAFEAEARKKVEFLPTDPGLVRSTSFGHIWSGGYEANYYGYQWARVIDADMWAAFTENGGFSMEKAKPVAEKLRDEIFSKGGSAPASVLFKRFRDREVDQKYFLQRLTKNPGKSGGSVSN